MSMLDSAWFCSPFDALLAVQGPPAVFLRDPEGRMRFDAEWTRDAYGREESLSAQAANATEQDRACWALARDRDSGYVQLVLVTSPLLLAVHPRLEFRRFGAREEALAALASLGRPPLDKQPWCP